MEFQPQFNDYDDDDDDDYDDNTINYMILQLIGWDGIFTFQMLDGLSN